MQLSRCWIQFKVFGSSEARAKLVRHYGHLVKRTITRILPVRVSDATYEDLVGAGVIGLIRAIDQYDPARETRFESYAVTMIRISLLDSMRADDWVPRHARERLRCLQHAHTHLEAKLGRKPTELEISAEMDIPQEVVVALVKLQGRCQISSLDENIFSDGDTYYDIIADDREDARDAADRHLLCLELAEYLETLTDRERSVLEMYYHQELTFAQIGRHLGVSESRAYQLHSQAMQRLRTRFAPTRDLPILR